jgi:hypothetical protein
MLERSTSHIGKGVALVAQAVAPVCPTVYRDALPSQIAEMITLASTKYVEPRVLGCCVCSTVVHNSPILPRANYLSSTY